MRSTRARRRGRAAGVDDSPIIVRSFLAAVIRRLIGRLQGNAFLGRLLLHRCWCALKFQTHHARGCIFLRELLEVLYVGWCPVLAVISGFLSHGFVSLVVDRLGAAVVNKNVLYQSLYNGAAPINAGTSASRIQQVHLLPWSLPDRADHPGRSAPSRFSRSSPDPDRAREKNVSHEILFVGISFVANQCPKHPSQKHSRWAKKTRTNQCTRSASTKRICKLHLLPF